MAASEPRVRERPLSPHLQVYRWQVQMASSILHRITGTILAVGALAFVYGLLALAGGPQRWAAFADCLAGPLGKLLLLGSLLLLLLGGVVLLWPAGIASQLLLCAAGMLLFLAAAARLKPLNGGERDILGKLLPARFLLW